MPRLEAQLRPAVVGALVSSDSAVVALSSFGGKTALVTGASRGIGRAIAVGLAEASVDVYALARDREALELLATSSANLPGRIRALICDITRGADLAAAMSELDDVAVLVNAAGWAPPRTPLHRISDADWRRTLDVCLHAPMNIVRALLPRMLEADEPAAIVQILSPAARRGRAGEAAYAAAKAGLRGFSESLRDELRNSAIKVVSVFPGYVDTDFVPANRKADRSRFLQPNDVARAVLQAIETSPNCCPEEIVLEPQRSPLPRS